jgi:hypothetical protein
MGFIEGSAPAFAKRRPFRRFIALIRVIAVLRAVPDAYSADTLADTLNVSRTFVEARMGIASTAGMSHSSSNRLSPSRNE